jgi:Ni,Fe-hydrogenase I large subunit
MSSPGIVPQNVLLVSESKLKNFTDIDANVSSAVLLPFIGVVQQTKLEYIIGAKYYKELLYEVSGNTISANTTNLNFLTYFVQPMLIWAAYAECLPSVFMRIKNNGIVTGAENTVTISEMQYMQNRADDRSQFFERRMIEEIIFNSNLYPLCFNYTSNEGLFPHLGKNYFSGVHMYNGSWTNSPGYMMKKYGLQFYSDPTYACCGF